MPVLPNVNDIVKLIEPGVQAKVCDDVVLIHVGDLDEMHRTIDLVTNLVMDNYRVTVPYGKSGEWSIEQTRVKRRDVEIECALRVVVSGIRTMPKCQHTVLKHNDKLVMIDTPNEIRDHIEPIYESARRGGDCLVNGLGLGMVVNAMLMRNKTGTVTVIEKSSDVIKLVAGTYQEKYGDRFKVIEGDAFNWNPPKGQRWTVVWHDIWDTVHGKNLRGMKKLHSKYKSRCDWQGSWSRHHLKKMREIA